MTNVQPPLNRPTPAQMDVWEDWSDREMLVAILVRNNAMAGILMNTAQELPNVMKMPMMKMATKMFIKTDKSSEV